jgi:multiple sugar transport system permease protein/raffinose/stachyose/melibiose transport system permease protein
MKSTLNEYRLRGALVNLGINIFLIAVSAACLFPLLWMLGTSLKTQQTVFSDMSLFPASPHWENYAITWIKGDFGIYFLNSFLYTVCVVSAIVIISSLAAYAFSRLEFPGRNILFFMFLAAMMIPLPGAFVPLFVVLKKLHLAGTGRVLPRLGYILALTNVGLSLSIYLLKTFFDQLPKDLEDAARIDGCSRLGIWWHLALPLARPAIAVVIIFNSLNVWNEYILAYVILKDKALLPLQRGLMVFQGAHMTQYPLLMAGITITVLPILLLYLLMQRYIIKGITAGALVG